MRPSTPPLASQVGKPSIYQNLTNLERHRGNQLNNHILSDSYSSVEVPGFEQTLAEPNLPNRSAQQVQASTQPVPPAAQMELWKAINANKPDQIDLAIRHGASINAKITTLGTYPLLYAAESAKRIDVLNEILEYKPALENANCHGLSPLLVAVESNNFAGLMSLLRAGSRIQECPYWDSTTYQNARFLCAEDLIDAEIVDALDAFHSAAPSTP